MTIVYSCNLQLNFNHTEKSGIACARLKQKIGLIILLMTRALVNNVVFSLFVFQTIVRDYTEYRMID